MALRRGSLLAALSSLTLLSSPALAVWPPAENATAEELSRPENWPNDPEYQYAPPQGTDGGRRGQWYHWSWVPRFNVALPGFRTDEVTLGAGNHVDRAWGVTIGDPRVLIAVLDSGIRWEHRDLLTKAALNTAELPLPQGATAYDANGDGVVNVRDYAQDPRVPCGTATARDPLRCVGADGQPNDPNGNGVLDAGDLVRVFSDGADGDRNGYVDDICGWDFFHDDNDAFDDTDFGHGTGEARDSAAATNDGVGMAGVCPRCMFIPVRVGDSFITDVNDYAQGVVYAVDRGASVVQEALGTIDNSTFAMRAQDYAWRHGAVIIASAADENSRHHNVPGTNNHTVYVHAVRYDGATLNASTTFLNFNNCTNYGAQLVLSVAALSCSSAATGFSAGMAGLLYSEALQTNLSPALSAEEVKQLLTMTADDINVPESLPTALNHDPTKYPSLPGWDQRFGYGRTNARRAVEWVRDRRIPPEVDLTGPRWFTVFDPDREPQRRLRLEGSIAARRTANAMGAQRFDYSVEWAPGVEPSVTAWRTLRAERNVTAPLTGTLAELDLRDLRVDNPGERENRYTITLRVRATAHYGGAVGDVPGETRRAFYVHRDPTVLPGYPVEVVASGESSPKLADLDGDGRREVVYGTADGVVHALRADGTELSGWPVHTGLMQGLDPRRMPLYRGARAYTGEGRAVDPDTVYEPIVATPGIADLDGDGDLEVVVASYHGAVHVWNHDGTPYGHGFPYTLPDVPSAMTSPRAILARGIFGAPLLYNLDGEGDRTLEVLFPAFDGKLYVLNSADASVREGFPVELHFPDPPGTPERDRTERNRALGALGVGDLDGDRRPDIVAVSSERLAGDPNMGAVYAVYADGNRHPGGPFHPNWPIPYNSYNFFPLVGEGLSSSPALADVDGDGRDEVALAGTANGTVLIARGVQGPHPARPSPSQLASLSTIRSSERGRLSNYNAQTVGFIPAFSLGSFGDLDNDGRADYTVSGASLDLGITLAGGGVARPFDHLMAAWNATTGRVFPGFPQVIEDYTFFVNPAIADVSRDGYPEVLLGTGGYYLRALDACGREPQGWPKFTGQWIIPSVAVGDLTGDGAMSVVSGTRGGYLWAWRTPGDARNGNIQWASFRHDNQNTGNWNTPLDLGTRRVQGLPTLGACPGDNAPTETPDGGSISPTPTHTTGGCGCRLAPSGAGGMALAGLCLAFASIRRRRDRRRWCA